MERTMDYTITIRMVEETTMDESGRMETGQKLISGIVIAAMIWIIVKGR
jgi:hypothetical protein